MSNLTFDPASWRDHGMAFGVACALHAGLAYLLFNLSHTPELAALPASVIHTQLVSLPAPVVVPEPPAPEPVTQPVVEKPSSPPPKAQAPVVDEAALALKRVQQHKRDLQHKRDQQQRQEQEQARKQREEAERREQQLAQQEQHVSSRRERLLPRPVRQPRRPAGSTCPSPRRPRITRNGRWIAISRGNARSPTRSRRKARSVTRRWSASAIRCSSNRRWQRRSASVTSPGW